MIFFKNNTLIILVVRNYKRLYSHLWLKEVNVHLILK